MGSASVQQYLRHVKVKTDIELDVMQINDSARALDAAMASKEAVLAKLTEQKNDAKSAIDRLDGKIAELRREISTGRGEREVLAEEVAFYSEGKVRTFGPGGRCLGERTLRQDEVQGTIDGLEFGSTSVAETPASEEPAPDAEVESEASEAVDDLEKEMDAALSETEPTEVHPTFLEGKEAALAGKDEADNPYKLGTEDRVRWLGGWFLGSEELAEKADKGPELKKSSAGPFDGASIVEEGRSAYLAGLSDLDNPYDKGSMKRVLWNQGWTDAEEERNEDDRNSQQGDVES